MRPRCSTISKREHLVVASAIVADSPRDTPIRPSKIRNLFGKFFVGLALAGTLAGSAQASLSQPKKDRIATLDQATELISPKQNKAVKEPE